MLFISILIATIVTVANAAALGGCSGKPHAGINLIFSTEEKGIMLPCEWVPIDDNVCKVLQPGSIPARAVKVLAPGGPWLCAFYHGQNCVDERNPYIEHGSGMYLPDDYRGRLGAVSCVRRKNE